MNRDDRRGTVLRRLRELREHTEVIGQILMDLWPVGVVLSSIWVLPCISSAEVEPPGANGVG